MLVRTGIIYSITYNLLTSEAHINIIGNLLNLIIYNSEGALIYDTPSNSADILS